MQEHFVAEELGHASSGHLNSRIGLDSFIQVEPHFGADAELVQDLDI